MTKWLIHNEGTGTVDVLKDRKSFAYDLDDVDEALYRIKRHRQYDKSDTIEVVDPDGYRHRLT
jgi:hypothetical protein